MTDVYTETVCGVPPSAARQSQPLLEAGGARARSQGQNRGRAKGADTEICYSATTTTSTTAVVVVEILLRLRVFIRRATSPTTRLTLLCLRHSHVKVTHTSLRVQLACEADGTKCLPRPTNERQRTWAMNVHAASPSPTWSGPRGHAGAARWQNNADQCRASGRSGTKAPRAPPATAPPAVWK